MRSRVSDGVIYLAASTLACIPAIADPPPSPIETPVPIEEARTGVRLVVVDVPTDATFVVEASDTRPPLISSRSLTNDQHLELGPGFVTITMKAADEARVVQLYAWVGAEVRYDWATSAVAVARAELFDRNTANAAADRDFDALMAVRSDPSALISILAAQRATIEAMADSPRAHYRRLHHATNAVQITGPEEAWTIIAPIPVDSIAWAAFSNGLPELRSLLGDAPQPTARFEDVRAAVSDIGLATALIAGDLALAGPTPEQQALATGYIAATKVAGPPVVGDTMPAFEMLSVEGTPVHSEDLLGVPYMLELWSTWCKPCIAQMPELHQLHEDVGRGTTPQLRIISVAVDDALTPVSTFRATRWPMPWTNTWVPSGDPIFAGWSLRGVPFAVLVDAEGTVLQAAAHLDLEDVRAAAR